MPGPIRILYLEDDIADARLVRARLEEAGLRDVTVVVDREQFEAALATGAFHVVLSDFRLAAMSGEEALGLARSTHGELPFILVTGTLGDERAVELLKQGVTDYVLKDNLVRLPSAILRALEEVRERTERRRAEEQLEQERRFLKALLETLEESIVACDEQGRLSLFNRSARELLGLAAEAVPERSSFSSGAIRLEVPLLRAFRGESIHDLELAMSSAGGPRTVRVSGRSIHDDAGRKLGAVVAAYDVTERKRLEEQLLHAQKMEAVGRLAGGVAHDFNNLLTAILGYAELLQAKLKPDQAAARQDTEEILAAGQRAAALTRQLLTFSRMEVTDPQKVDVSAAVREVERMLRRLIGEDITIHTSLAPSPWPVLIDPGQLAQVIMNLAVNARDAMPSGGKLVLETLNVELSGDYASQHVDVAPGDYLMLSVSDTGVGMDEGVRSRIFEPFFTTKEKGRGTGLGLSTVYGIVKQAGGNVTVYSEPGKGTTFKVYLPRTEAEARQTPSQPVMKAIGRTDVVLVVEDEDGVRRLTRLALEDQGYRVLEAANGAEALRVVEQGTPVRLVLTDGVMPDMSGRELVAVLSQKLPGCKFLIMSGYTDEAIVHHGLLEGGTAFLQKPFTPRALAKKVREVLENGGG